jgi:hypothetical protein
MTVNFFWWWQIISYLSKSGILDLSLNEMNAYFLPLLQVVSWVTSFKLYRNIEGQVLKDSNESH